jgi:serine/threonine-protein kinase HipA
LSASIHSAKSIRTTYAEDQKYTKAAIDAVDGPVVLVGHSYGGSIITEAGNHPKVAALVYIAAFALDEGESCASIEQAVPQASKAFTPDGNGNWWINEEQFASLKEIETVAREISAERIDDLEALRRWLKVLVAPGASLGGARPKASFKEINGSLWIAKFPARDDTRDVGAWGALAQRLGTQAGIEVPASELRRFGGEYHTFCVQRFDRVGARRRFYASAMALLRKDQSKGSSYLELAEFLQTHGAEDHIGSDLEQLFRRVAFNVAIGNRDDHLRNHGFLLTPNGWRLAPAFDLNPNTDRADHVLNIDEHDSRPSLATVIETSEWYVESNDRGAAIVAEVLPETRKWRRAAQSLKIARADIELTAAAFAESDATKG